MLLLARLHGCNTEACYVVRLKKWDYYDPDAHVDTRWRFELECAVRTVAAQCTDRNNDYVDGVTENGQKWVGVLMEDSDEFLTQYPYSGFPDGPLIGGFLTYTTGHFTDDLAHHGVVLNDPK